MIKKVTIILVIIFVLAAGVFILSERGFLPGIRDLITDGSAGSNDVWDYEITEGTIKLTKYKGRSATPVIPGEIEGVPVTALSSGLFANNTRVKEITIPDTVKSLGTGIFENCTELNLVNLPVELSSIPARTFSGCENLKVVQLPYTVRNIGTGAFSGCTSLSYMNLPDSITSIDADAFLNCSALAEVNVSRNLNSLGSHAFKGTQWLANQKDEFVIIGNQVLIKYNGIAETVEVPLGVTQVTDAFEDNLFTLEVVLPSSLTSIGPRAFSGCRNLERVEIPNNVKTIGDSAFRGCSHLNPIELPDSLTRIGAAAFQSCSSLERIIIPEGVTSLPSLVLANCEKLRSVQIPKSVLNISSDIISFSGVSDLRVFKGSAGEDFAVKNGYSYSYLQQANDSFIFQQRDDGVQVVLYTGNQYNVTIPETLEGDPVTSISDILFQHNYSVRSVELPRTITKISDYSFADMSELRSVTLPDTLESIGIGAFTNDILLGELTIPESVSSIADDAFIGCPSLIIVATEGSYAYDWAVSHGIRIRDIKVVDTADFSFVKPAGVVLVSGYTGMSTNPELPRSNEYGEAVSGIADEAFRGTEVESIILPEGYSVIGENSFADISVPLEITLPRSVTSVADNCFDNTNVTIYGYNDSYAEEYARNHKIKFLIIFEWEL